MLASVGRGRGCGILQASAALCLPFFHHQNLILEHPAAASWSTLSRDDVRECSHVPTYVVAVVLCGFVAAAQSAVLAAAIDLRQHQRNSAGAEATYGVLLDGISIPQRPVTEIEVIDLDVSTSDKMTRKLHTIITKDKGLLSKEEIEYTDGETVTAKNGLEAYSYNLRYSLSDEEITSNLA
ncbi:hypothetical protein B0H21DRAFT_824278 [Amylocystis lapponica]|nr:hypothetical protein B0H21DRAFT_824278 [Amylocystis lapponica]